MHPIPFAAIDAYARRHGLKHDDFDALVNAVRAMDAVFIQIVAQKVKTQHEQARKAR